MSSEWPMVSLGDCIELDTGFPFKSAEYTDTDEAVRLLRGDNIAQGQLRWDGVKRWVRKEGDALGAYELHKNDLVLAMDRPWITAGLKFAKVRDNDLPALLVQRVARLRPKSIIDADFLHSVVSSPDFTQHIQNITTGTAVPHVSGKQIQEYKFVLPDLLTQRYVGKLLMSLDDRITLMRETNATLEAIAQALFKSWFVDFDPVRAKMEGRASEGMDEATAALFPDSFEESELGLVPKGWRGGSIGDFAAVIDCLHAKKPELLLAGRPFLQLNNIRDDGLLDTSKLSFISDVDYNKWISRIEVSEGDCVITNVGRVGAVAQIPASFKAAMGRNMTAIRMKVDWPYPTFLVELLQSTAMRAEIERRTDVGTILNALNVRNIPLLRCVLPPKTILHVFEDYCRPLRSAMEANLERAASLATLRDTLLPRLISGQLRLPEAEATLAEV